MHTEVHVYLAHAVVNEEYILHKGSLTEFKVSLKMGRGNHIVHWDTIMEQVPAVCSNFVTPSGRYVIGILSCVLLGQEVTQTPCKHGQ